LTKALNWSIVAYNL